MIFANTCEYVRAATFVRVSREPPLVTNSAARSEKSWLSAGVMKALEAPRLVRVVQVQKIAALAARSRGARRLIDGTDYDPQGRA
jgi:hypothetical protein